MLINKSQLLTALLCLIMYVSASEAAESDDVTNMKYQIYTNIAMTYIPLFGLLFLGMVALYLEYRLVCDNDWNPSEATRFMGLTTIVILTVFVVILAKSIDSNLTTAIIGFLGTIAGYLAGSSKQFVSVNTNNPPADANGPPVK